MKDSKTTYLGIAAILTASGAIMSAIFDADPATNPDWGALIAAFIAGVGLIFAKDAKDRVA